MGAEMTKDSFNDFEEARELNVLKAPKVDKYAHLIENQLKSSSDGQYNSNTTSSKFKSPEETHLDSKKERRKAYYVKLIKRVNPEIKDIHELWREIPITNLISEQKLLKAGADEILYSGELFKCVHNSIIRDSAYSPIFVILTKTELRYKLFLYSVYRSRENFLRNMKAKHKLALFNILSVNRVTIDHNSKHKKYNHFFLELLNTSDIRTSIVDTSNNYQDAHSIYIYKIGNKLAADVIRDLNTSGRLENNKNSFNSSITEKRSRLDESRQDNYNTYKSISFIKFRRDYRRQ
jgi:hypothetical protein